MGADQTNFGLTIILIATLLLIAIQLLRTRVKRVTSNLLNLAKNEDYNKDLSYLSSNKDIDKLVKAINRLLLGYRKSNRKSLEEERINTINNLTAQVAHDIRSPLEALKSTKKELIGLAEEERLKFNTAINRIEEIAYSLLKMKKDTRKNDFISDLENTIEQILIEKRMQYKGFENLNISYIPTSSNFGVFVKINPNSLKRILSNLINNSAEALGYSGQIDILVRRESDRVNINVRDNSKGFDENYLKNPFVEGFTTKEDGNGLGLFYAKQELDKVGGKIFLYNDAGSCVEVTLDSCEAPSYYLKSINLCDVSRVIILDDDENIHNVWMSRLKTYDLEIEHFYSATDLLEAYNVLPKNTLLLSDYELLGEDKNGLDCIKELDANSRSILITARSEESHIVDKVKEMGVSLLPKSMALNVPISDELPNKVIVLIDDDELVHMTWKRKIGKKDKKFYSFYSVDEFLNNSHNFDNMTPIYVDSNLGDNLRGEVLSEDIFKMGFHNLYITTGYDSSTIDKPNWIKSVLGKNPDITCL